MGLGVHALLAAEGVSGVCFRSGHHAVTIDTARWWTDATYVAGWRDQVTLLESPQSGLEIDITCTVGVRNALTHELTHDSSALSERPHAREGYADLLRITLDGVALRTATPAWVMPRPILATTYQGCALTIGTNDWRSWGVVNWFGQIILHPSRIPFYLHVRAGRPVNPLAPSRRGLIRDAALAALEGHVADALFSFLATTPPALLKPAWIALAWTVAPERARQLPVCVVARLLGPDPDGAIGSAEDLNDHAAPEVVALDAAPLLVDEEIQVATATLDRSALTGSVWLPPSSADERAPWTTAEYGRDAFLTLLEAAGHTPYTLIHGDRTRLPIRTIWWQPGPARADGFNERGRWGLGTADAPPSDWQPVSTDVWAFTTSSDMEATDVDWAVGTADPLQFLATQVWAGYGPYDDSELSRGEQERYYQGSVGDWKRRLLGACVSWRFTLSEVRAQMPTPTARLHQITCVYADDTTVPVAILVENAAGEQQTLRIVD